MQINRWLGVATGMLMMLIAGTIYLFPAWATALRAQLHYTVEQTNLVGTLLNLGIPDLVVAQTYLTCIEQALG
jgi:hypothetical protein